MAKIFDPKKYLLCVFLSAWGSDLQGKMVFLGAYNLLQSLLQNRIKFHSVRFEFVLQRVSHFW